MIYHHDISEYTGKYDEPNAAPKLSMGQLVIVDEDPDGREWDAFYRCLRAAGIDLTWVDCIGGRDVYRIDVDDWLI